MRFGAHCLRTETKNNAGAPRALPGEWDRLAEQPRLSQHGRACEPVGDCPGTFHAVPWCSKLGIAWERPENSGDLFANDPEARLSVRR